MPLPALREMAEAAYAAYGASTDHKKYQGLPMPDWDELTDRIQMAWIEVAGAVALRTIASLTGSNGSLEPDVGDVVLVAMDPDENNGAAAAPAVVTRVWSPTTINVRFLADGPSIGWRTSLTFVEELPEADGYSGGGIGKRIVPAVWTWPGSGS